MSLPNRVTLELTNRCNRSCRGCPRLKMTYPRGDMDLGLLASIVAQLPPETVIVPFFRGESVFHPYFVETLKMLGKFPSVQMATNGDLLTDSKKDAILETCSFISYSLHKPLLSFEIPDVTKFLDKAQSIGLDTQVSILETEIPEGARQLLIDGWLQHVDRFRIYVEHSKEGFGDVESKYRKLQGDWPCTKPFNDMVVYWDGKVALCNHDWDNQDPLGDLNTQTVEEVWNGDKYLKLRTSHETGRRKEVDTCKHCDYWMLEYMPEKIFGEVYSK